MIQCVQHGEGKVTIQGDATLPELDSLYEALKNIKSQSEKQLTLDLTQVGYLDATAAQVFLAFKKSALPGHVKYECSSENIVQVLERLGLAEQLLD